jgi:acetyl-CoA/propionyl-CoA carboxylase biotin carboxyl carrier protein
MLVNPGDMVVVGDFVCVLEAMKMEQPILASQEGTVESIAVSAGDSVIGGQVLAVIY